MSDRPPRKLGLEHPQVDAPAVGEVCMHGGCQTSSIFPSKVEPSGLASAIQVVKLQVFEEVSVPDQLRSDHGYDRLVRIVYGSGSSPLLLPSS
jgi:hypothetical protein